MLSFTSSGSFLYLDGNNVKEASFEGLKFDNSALTREVLKPYMNKPIECKFDKNMTKIRYQNF